MVGSNYVLNIPVYRLPEDKYYEDLNENFESMIREHWDRGFRQRNPDIEYSFRNHHRSKYGGSWEFNEVVGYVKIYFMDTQVRGEYWSTIPTRKVRTRQKTFEYKSRNLSCAVEIRAKTSKEVLLAIEEYIQGCVKKLKRRHIDLNQFEKIKEHVDWLAIYQENNTLA